ncbi:MAG: lauroyl acyltransferase [Mariprofundaceae bacterium]
MNTILAIAIRLIFWSIRIIPVRITGAMGACIGRLIYFFDRHRRTVAINNLARVYPDKDRAWHKYIARESLAELGRTFFELPHVYLRSKEFLLSRITVENEEALQHALAQNRGCFVTACHHSNWELGALSISMLGHPTSIIYRPMNLQPLEEFFKAQRERFGAIFKSRLSRNLRWIPQTLKSGGTIAVMIDQSINTGTPVPFLGHLANTTTVPAIFALKQNTPVVGVALQRHGRSFQFTLRFWLITPPEQTGEKEKDTYEFMHSVCKSFDTVIHERPELWLWSHRRWRNLDEPELFK